MKYLKILLRIFLWPVYWLSGFFPRDPKIWVFGSHNNAFIDNSKYLFIYASNNVKDVKAIWISGNRELIKKLNQRGYKALYRWSIKGIFTCLRAKVHIFSAYISDINWATSRGALKLNLWHGIPLKRIEYDIETGKLGKIYNSNLSFLYKFFIPRLFIKFDFLLSTSSLITDIFSKAFRIKKEQCLEFGYPRCDHFFYEREKLKAFIEKESPETLELLEKMNKFNKVLIYLPTFRENSTNDLSMILNFEVLQSKLAEYNFLLVIKQHPSIKNKISGKFSNIIFLDSATDVYMLLPFTDVLITDYSSVFFDYILLNKPILFFCYDKEHYLKEERGFYFDYDNLKLGKLINTFEDLKNEIDNILINRLKTYEQDKIKLFWNGYSGNSCEKITSFIRAIANSGVKIK